MLNLRSCIFLLFQWNKSENAGFSGSDEIWLPISEDYQIFNVDNQQDKYLATFRNISELRQLEAFKTGNVYFPYHDDDIFSFLRYIIRLENGLIFLISFLEYLNILT